MAKNSQKSCVTSKNKSIREMINSGKGDESDEKYYERSET
jgi:hypothetical protein